MAKRKAASSSDKKKSAKPAAKRDIEQYEHEDKQRVNNPPVGLVTPSTDPPESVKKTYAYDPHLDPQLVWAGKAEHTSFEVPTVSLHVHERIDPCSIIEAVKSNGHSHDGEPRLIQQSLFAQPKENPPLREAIDFYKHPHGWSNRLIAGDSMLVMNSLLEKEGLAGKVKMVYFDPPYGIRYRSNFQPFVSQNNVPATDRDQDLNAEPEMLRAFRDTWELGIHSYLTYLRDRLLLAKELLDRTGSCFVQISDENVHYVRELMDEVFGSSNFVVTIFYRKKGSQRGNDIKPINDHILWYCREKDAARPHLLYSGKLEADSLAEEFEYVEYPDGTVATTGSLTNEAINEAIAKGAKLYIPEPLTSGGEYRTQLYTVQFEGRSYNPPTGNCWKFNEEGMARIIERKRVHKGKNQIRFKKYHTDFPYRAISNLWDDIAGASGKIYVVQTARKAVQRCMLMTTDPGDLVLDFTCGSGTTAHVAEEWGRRWITCDTSRIAITLTKQRLLTSVFPYHTLAHPDEGVASGFEYKTADHVTSTTIANGLAPKPETFFDRPLEDTSKVRVTGPFTVEAVPAPTVLPVDEVPSPKIGDVSVARTGVTLRQDEWRSEMAKAGVRAQGGKRVEFTRLEPLAGARYLHAVGETRNGTSKRIAVSFGPEHAPLEQRQVELAWEEARGLSPRPEILVFAAFHFDPEAAKDIDELDPQKTGMTFLRSQMNTDLLTEDLKKKRASNESFWLIGQPDVDLRQVKSGNDKGKWQVEIRGFDYYNPNTGQIESGNASRIAMWLLDTDYDGRSLFPRQVFFPMAGPKDGWARLAKSLKAEIDEDKIEAYRGTQSLPFAEGKHKRIAVKIVDDRGIESLKLLELN